MLIKKLGAGGDNQSRPLTPIDPVAGEGDPGTQKLDALRQALGNTMLLPRNTILQGRYEIEQVLGVGGMSTVYRARDLRFLNVIRYCAIKEMPDTSPDAKTGALRMANFQREASLLATLSHPGIVRIYDFFAESDRVYLVLEYLEGKDLETMLDERGGPIPEAEVLNWSIQICRILSYLHHHKPQPIVFRDMKPSNIMVMGDKVTLVDFGIAKMFQSEKRGTMIGTEGYSPPEQYRGQAEPRADIYALGATMHHLLTYSDPRSETPFTFHERPPRQLNPHVSEWMESIVLRALEYEVERRWATVDEMLTALEEGQRQMQSEGTAPAPVPLAPASGPPPGLAAPAMPPGYALPGMPPGYALPAMPPGYPVAPYVYPPLPYGYPMPATGDPPTTLIPAPPVGDAIPGVEILWSFTAEDELRSTALVAKGVVFIGSYDTNIYALNAKTGDFVWKLATEAGICSSPAMWEDMLIFGSEDNTIYALEARRGTVSWVVRTGGPVRSSPRVLSGQVYIGSDDQNLYCLDARTGRVHWKYRTWGTLRSTPAAGKGMSIIGASDGNLYAVDATNGALRWKFHSNGAINSSPVMSEALAYFGSKDRYIYAIDLETGWGVWKFRTDHYVTSSPLLIANRLYIGSSDGLLYCLDAQNGRLVWKYHVEGQIASSPRAGASNIYFGSTDGFVYCLNATTGEPVWRFRTEGPVVASPAIDDGIVYIGSMDHKLYALPV